MPPCLSVSAQARKFVSQSLGANWETADFSPSGLNILRHDNSDFGSLSISLLHASPHPLLCFDLFLGAFKNYIKIVLPSNVDPFDYSSRSPLIPPPPPLPLTSYIHKIRLCLSSLKYKGNFE